MAGGAAERAAALFRVLTPGIVEVSDLETAELAKLACNAYRYSVFAFANELARLCRSVGASAREVRDAAAAGYDRAAMPFAGPVGGSCLPKDTAILSRAFLAHGAPASELLNGVRTAHRGTAAQVADEQLRALHGDMTDRSHDPTVPEHRQRALGYQPCAEAKEAV
ncbi:hypothetical protein [Streptomyces sp. NPDC058308]|uniref:hypothetical protein n=1 Tax=Streptomyces sp. NPDC058308 TaxID=3346440 RepID=UPI0036ED9301